MLILIRSLLVFFFSFVVVSSIQVQDLDCVCKEIKRNGEDIILECVCRPKDNPNPRDQADSNINKGVVAAWTFDDGRVTDAIGKNHGKLFKGAMVKNGGKFGKALDVNGSDDCRADIKVSKDIEKVLEKAFTVSYWLYVRQGRNHSGVWKGEKVGWGPTEAVPFLLIFDPAKNFSLFVLIVVVQWILTITQLCEVSVCNLNREAPQFFMDNFP